MYRRIIAISILFLLLPAVMLAQSEVRHLRRGNRYYKKSEHRDAEMEYRKALAQNGESLKGEFNLGDALYSQDKFQEAVGHFGAVIEHSNASDSMRQHSFYNLGNTYFKQEKYKESAQAYKQALRINPRDQLARYNLSEALRRLKQQQKEQQQDKDKKDQQKDKKDQQDQKDNQQQQNKQDKNQQDQQKEQKNENDQQQNQDKPQNSPPRDQQQRDGQMTQEDAQQLLKALEKQEGDLQQQVQKAKAAKLKKRNKTNKDW